MIALGGPFKARITQPGNALALDASADLWHGLSRLRTKPDALSPADAVVGILNGTN